MKKILSCNTGIKTIVVLPNPNSNKTELMSVESVDDAFKLTEQLFECEPYVVLRLADSQIFETSWTFETGIGTWIRTDIKYDNPEQNRLRTKGAKQNDKKIIYHYMDNRKPLKEQLPVQIDCVDLVIMVRGACFCARTHITCGGIEENKFLDFLNNISKVLNSKNPKSLSYFDVKSGARSPIDQWSDALDQFNKESPLYAGEWVRNFGGEKSGIYIGLKGHMYIHQEKLAAIPKRKASYM